MQGPFRERRCTDGLSGRRRWLAVAAVVALAATGAMVTATGAGCGADGDGASPSPSAPSTSAPVAVRPDFTTSSASPSPTGVAHVAVGGDLLVVRGGGSQWSVWRITPSTGIEKRVAELPFEPAAAAASPDHRFVAYVKSWLPRPGWRRTLAIIDVRGRVEWPDLHGTGLRSVDDMTWLSPSRLLVSGPVPKGNAPPEDDRLYLCDARTGELAPFHGLAGADPSVAADTGGVVFRRLTTLKETGDGPLVHEDLLLFDPRTGVLATITSCDYVIYAAGNLYVRPAVSPDGRLVFATQTGSDPSATFRLYRTEDGVCLWERRRECTPILGAWDAERRRLAFWGWGGSGATVWVYDVAAGRFTKSLTKRDERVLDGQVTGLDWSDRGDLAASTDDGPVEAVFVAPGGDPRAFVRLCGGRLPVWLD